MLSLSRTTNPLCRRFLRQARGQISVFSQENQLSEVSDHPAALFADCRAVSFFLAVSSVRPSVTRPPASAPPSGIGVQLRSELRAGIDDVNRIKSEWWVLAVASGLGIA